MSRESLVVGKRLLIVDDEPDVLDSLEDLLSTSYVTKAISYEEAKRLLETERFDIAILDIMGVRGYELLRIATGKNIPCLMLTAHALSSSNAMKSRKEGAALYVPKDKIGNIHTYLEDVLEAKRTGKSTWSRWFERFGAYFDEKFEKDWRYKDKDFWAGL
jgi:DNA-binding NtrC family response regulator